MGDTIIKQVETSIPDLTPAHKDTTTGVHGVGGSTVESASGATTKVSTHAALTTGVHGVGAGTVAKTADIPSAGAVGDIVASTYGGSASAGASGKYGDAAHKHALGYFTASQAIYTAGGARSLSFAAGSTIYNNTSGKARLITVTAYESTYVLTLSAYVMSGTPPTTIVVAHAHTNVVDQVSITFIVPAGYYYKVYASSNSGTCTLSYWTEWDIG